MSRQLTNSEKAAILFLSLGEEITAEVFRGLEEAEIQMITQYITNMETPSLDDIKGVLQETMERISYRHVLPQEVAEYINNVLIKALGEKKAAEILRKLQAPMLGKATNLKVLKDLDSETLANLIRGEHPQIIALILTHLSPDKAAEILAYLPEETRTDVALRICNLERIRPGVIQEISEYFRNKLTNMQDSESQAVGGVSKIAEIMNHIDRASEDSIMSSIEKIDASLSENIRMLMFTFEDLGNIGNQEMQALLKEIPKDELVLALKTASVELKDLILRNMSERAAQMTIEDLESMGAVKLHDVEKAQQNIVKIARKLEEEGKIVLKGGKGGDVMV
ncbi:MAG: flagellar motor switch protein FliG [bacterium]